MVKMLTTDCTCEQSQGAETGLSYFIQLLEYNGKEKDLRKKVQRQLDELNVLVAHCETSDALNIYTSSQHLTSAITVIKAITKSPGAQTVFLRI